MDILMLATNASKTQGVSPGEGNAFSGKTSNAIAMSPIKTPRRR
jgi:hypothetical protein